MAFSYYLRIEDLRHLALKDVIIEDNSQSACHVPFAVE